MNAIERIEERIAKTIAERTRTADGYQAKAAAAAERIAESKKELDRLLDGNADESKISSVLSVIAAQQAIETACKEKLTRHTILTPDEVTKFAESLYSALCEEDDKLVKQLQPLYAEIKAIAETRQKTADGFLNALHLLEPYRDPDGTNLLTAFSRPPASEITKAIQISNDKRN